MNREAMQGSWNQIKSSVQGKWTKLTHDDVELAKGKFETLVSSLQQRYGLAKDKAEQELDAFIKTIDLSKSTQGAEAKTADQPKAPNAAVAGQTTPTPEAHAKT